MTNSPLAFVALTAASALIGVPPPSGTNLMAGSMFGILNGTLLFMAGMMLGSLLSFVLIRLSLRDFIMRRLSAYEAKMKGLDVAIAKEGALFIVILLRLSPAMPTAVATAMLSLTSVGIVPFAVGTFAGLLPFSVVYVYVGSLGQQMTSGGGRGGGGSGLLDDPVQLCLTIAGLVTTLGLTWKVSKVATAALDAAQQQEEGGGAAAAAAAAATTASKKPTRRASSTPKAIKTPPRAASSSSSSKKSTPAPASSKRGSSKSPAATRSSSKGGKAATPAHVRSRRTT